MDVECAHGPILGTILAFAWIKENQEKFIRIVSVLDEILTGHLLDERIVTTSSNLLRIPTVSNKIYINSLVLELNPSSNLQHCEFKLRDLIFVMRTLTPHPLPPTNTCE